MSASTSAMFERTLGHWGVQGGRLCWLNAALWCIFCTGACIIIAAGSASLLRRLAMGSFSKDVCVIGGGGHVGLPLAMTFADCGLKTVIYDINAETIDSIRRG